MAAIRKALSRRFASILRPPAAPSCRASRLSRFPAIQRRPFFQPALPQDRHPAIPVGGGVLAERIRGLSPDRISLDGLIPLSPPARPVEPEESLEKKGMAVEVVRKLLRAQRAQATLRATGKRCITYPEFLQICCEASNDVEGTELARSLDRSGTVVVFGNVVLLNPEEVVKTVDYMMRSALEKEPNSSREELAKMEVDKAEIDRKAAARVRMEMCCGLGWVVLQTFALMDATWLLSWDVMEPICFFITSLYFFLGYAFFLRTRREPSFESIYAVRFATNQKKLIEARNFDVTRYNELVRASQYPFNPKMTAPASSCHCDMKYPSVVGWSSSSSE